MFCSKGSVSEHAVILPNEHTVVSNAKYILVDITRQLVKTFQLPGQRAHVVEMKAIDRDDELREVQFLVYGLDIGGKHMEKRARCDIGNEISFGLGLGRTNSPPVVYRELTQARKIHLID